MTASEVLPVILYILGAILLVALIVLTIKLTITIHKIDKVVDNITEKVTALDGVFSVVNAVSNKFTFITDKVVNIIYSLIEKITKRHKEEKIAINIEQIAKSFVAKEQISWHNTNFFYLQKEKNSWKGLNQMIEPFPCIAHHSFWCMFYWTQKLGPDPIIQEKWLQNKIENSAIFWEEKLQGIKPVTINLNCFEENADDFAKEWIRWSNDEKNVSSRL